MSHLLSSCWHATKHSPSHRNHRHHRATRLLWRRPPMAPQAREGPRYVSYKLRLINTDDMARVHTTKKALRSPEYLTPSPSGLLHIGWSTGPPVRLYHHPLLL